MAKIQRALLSVSDKTGLLELAQFLAASKVEMISTGGTFKAIQEAGLPVTYISDVTGFPEILDGRVKTLHPAIHGGLLAIRDSEEHRCQLAEQRIRPIDLVVVNLYPFAATVAKPEVTLEDAIENIDIGGPSMLRSAAKNHHDVTVVVDPADYPVLIKELRANQGQTTLEFRKQCALKVFQTTAAYDSMIFNYFNSKYTPSADGHPELLQLTYHKQQSLRYGENPHQQAAFYVERPILPGTVAAAKQLHGKELSFNNINDANAAIEMVKEFSETAVVAIKHANPCGVGVADTPFSAYQKAFDSDPVSIFGGIVAFNRPVDLRSAEAMSELFLEIVIAPEFAPEAFEVLARKKNLRLLELPELSHASRQKGLDLKKVAGGLLVQDLDLAEVQPSDLKVVTQRQPTENELKELLFGWKVVKHVKSNAIVITKDNGTIGIGPGQTNRVGAVCIAIGQAGEKVKGSCLASDAYFPMPDSVEEAAKAGVTAIIQPGGSIRDQDSITMADRYGMAMVFTGIRHFKH
ncbi:phosphoribosylaminoimidazolecarboxamide formyltransferase/IMP cyclohydrolase [Hydrogenispora ethanolica]|uniref:Bifunctional purine biosynthesis protein PurH n=1 Tax=Hydrogenispora ethanolica TaxID=1082276 RepID=A0A4R1QMB7_HYDET|nr:bifunctional phosphoribosylaminoimidazolecarboxamide formyltransferase/IMP cyclohydrolase [Hydrogenispora ethanolica]TCL54397.1 phosphoribosylaminoimidazolecarboxamide formyltransferase/IMP cyclohydrolase [Hydrogenispora ethanolica]